MTYEQLTDIRIEQPDETIRACARSRWDHIAKPIDGMGEFEKLICGIAAMQGREVPQIDQKALIIMCADNGIVEEGVTQTGWEVTRDVATLMGQRKSSVGILTSGYPCEIFVYDVGIRADETPEGVIDKKICKGTANFLKQPAMTQQQCLEAIQTGIDAVSLCSKQEIGIIATGEMGIGNTTTSTAVLCALTGSEAKTYTGKGSGLTDEGLQRKIRVIDEGLKRYGFLPDMHITAKEAFAALQNLGGLDIAALTGVFIGGGIYHIPVVIDGLISGVAALVAKMLVPDCAFFMIPSHMGREKGMARIMEELSLKPVIHGDLALGEGSGAVMLFPLLDMAMHLYRQGTTFSSADIDAYERMEKR